MRILRMTLCTTAFTAAILIVGTLTQDVQAQVTVRTPKETGEQAQPTKSAVDMMIEELEKRGETVVRGCIEKCADSTGSDDQVKVGQAIDLIQPTYPAIARAAHATGQVVVRVVINEEGKVIAAQSVSGHPLLQSASVDAARQTMFMPTLVDGKPVNVVATLTYTFVMQ
jgi:TonB family protein